MILKRIENEQHLIEVMESNKINVSYRFTFPFMRETIYQRMIN